MRQTVRPNRPGRFSGSLHNIRPSQPEALQVFAQAVAVVGGGAFQPRNVKQGAASGSHVGVAAAFGDDMLQLDAVEQVEGFGIDFYNLAQILSLFRYRFVIA